MKRQRREGITHTCLIRESEDAGQKAEISKKVCESGDYARADGMAAGGPPPFLLRASPSAALPKQQEKLTERKQIKRHAAELKRKIPPAIIAAVCAGQQKLFPDLGNWKQNGESIQKTVLLLGGKAAGRKSQKQRQGEAGQEDKHGKLHSAAFWTAHKFFCFLMDKGGYAFVHYGQTYSITPFLKIIISRLLFSSLRVTYRPDAVSRINCHSRSRISSPELPSSSSPALKSIQPGLRS